MHAMKKIITTLLIILIVGQLMPAKAGQESGDLNADTLSGSVVHSEGIYLPSTMVIPGTLRTPIDTRYSKVGDQVTVQTTQELFIGDYAILPARSFLHGYISHLKRPGRMYKNAQIEIDFDSASIPGEEGPRRVDIKGRVRTKQLLAKATKVNDGETYNRKRLTRAIPVGIATAVPVYAVAATTKPFATWGMWSTFMTPLVTAGAFAAGVTAAGAMITRDDKRIESGTDLEIMLEGASYETFDPDHTLAKDKSLELKPSKEFEHSYDAFSAMKAESIAN